MEMDTNVSFTNGTIIKSQEILLNEWNTEEAKKYIIHDVFLVVYFIIGFVGNLTVLVVYTTKIRKENESRYLIPVLAFADLCACCLRTPFELWKTLLPVNFQNIVGCQTIWFLVNIFTFSSIYLLAVITFQRYLKVCRPLGPQLTVKWLRVSLIVIAILSIAFSFPFILWNEKLEIPNQVLNVTGYICGANVIKVDQNSNSFISFICFISIVLVVVMLELTVLNSLIAQKIYTVIKASKIRSLERKTMHKMSTRNKLSVGVELSNISKECSEINSTDITSCTAMDGNSPPDKSEVSGNFSQEDTKLPTVKQERPSSKRFSVMFMVISVAFILSYIPQIFLLFSLVNDRMFWIKSTHKQTIIYKFVDQMVTINNIVNPFAYAFFDKKFRKAAKNLLCKCK